MGKNKSFFGYKFKNIYVFIGVIILILLISNVTYSFWILKFDEKTSVVFTVGDEYVCEADGGGDITSDDVVLAPATCNSEKFAIKREVKVTPSVKNNISVSMDLWLNVNELSTGLSNSQNFRYALTTNQNSCTSDLISSGNFNGKSNGDIVILLDDVLYHSTTTDTYYLYIWLDEAETSSSTMNQIFNLSLGGTCVEKDTIVTFDSNGGIIGEVISYTNPGEHIYTVPSTGKYMLEVWGGQGGNTVYNSILYGGGYGGYSVGNIDLKENDKLYVNVGGQGQSVENGTASVWTGYNGGGYAGYFLEESGSYNSSHSGGGGATHIATVSGLLSSLLSNTDSILIVAGGGGGSSLHEMAPSYSGEGGHAGGYKGNSASPANDACYNYGTGGTQSSAGDHTICSGGYDDYVNDWDVNPGLSGFGFGANYSQYYSGYGYAYSGGGGGYYGGGAGYHAPGGGGSGYIGNSRLTNKAMYCYNCSTSSSSDTLTYSVSNVSFTEKSRYAKSGNGAVRITKLTSVSSVTYDLTYGTLPVPTRDGYSFLGWNTKADGSGTTITSSSHVSTRETHTLYAIWKIKSPVFGYSCSNASVGSNYFFTYTGQCEVIDDGDGDWRIKFLTSGEFKSGLDISIDAFLVGGGGGGGSSSMAWSSDYEQGRFGGGGGGGGGFCNTSTAISLTSGTGYDITIGTGGGGGVALGHDVAGNDGSTGGLTSAFGISANGGGGGGGASFAYHTGTNPPIYVGTGGTGSNAGGAGGSDRYGATNGSSGATACREFGSSSGTIYAGGGGGAGGGETLYGNIGTAGSGGSGGGGGGNSTGIGSSGKKNTGGGGGGGGTSTWGTNYSGGSGGSGIIVIRNQR